MISIMSSAYNGLSTEEKERVFLIAVGKDEFSNKNQNFCQGFAACPDTSWWTTWNANQRDVYFYIKNEDDSWEYYCRYSMNDFSGEVEGTIREMLKVTEPVTAATASPVQKGPTQFIKPINSTINDGLFVPLPSEPILPEGSAVDNPVPVPLVPSIYEYNTNTSDVPSDLPSSSPVPVLLVPSIYEYNTNTSDVPSDLPNLEPSSIPGSQDPEPSILDYYPKFSSSSSISDDNYTTSDLSVPVPIISEVAEQVSSSPYHSTYLSVLAGPVLGYFFLYIY